MTNALRFYDVTFFCEGPPGITVKPSRQDEKNPWKFTLKVAGSELGRPTIIMFFQNRDDLKAMSDALQRAVESLPREEEK